LKKIAHSDNINVKCYSPFPDSVIEERHNDYVNLSDSEFRKKYRQFIFAPAYIELSGKMYGLQYNFCCNTFCKWYGLPQKKFDEVKSKPSRYKMVSSRSNSDDTSIHCNDILIDTSFGTVLGNNTSTISNWSLAEEIKRLITINTVVDIEPDYIFHKEGCSLIDKTPFDNKEAFIKRGKSSANAVKYQCKECKKLTNVLPSQDKNFNYNQKRNDILIQFSKLILSRTPVKRICEILEIGEPTYYSKLEWLYKKCLEFNSRYEEKALKELHFRDLWINTDALIYNLNNIRMKGKADEDTPKTEEKKMQTYLISSADLKTGYVFRSDIAYDYEISLDDIQEDTEKFHCDHSYPFLRKNDRLKYSYCPQPPTNFDSQTIKSYESELEIFDNRKNYVSGCHVKSVYTELAHYFLLRNTLKADYWYFVSDDDSSIQNSIFRIFADEFSNGSAMYFTCQSDKSLSLEEAGAHAFKRRNELRKWAKANKIRERSEGVRLVNLISFVYDITDEELTNYIMQVNSRAINNYFQTVRRKISILERPLVTARGDGRSYIYANYNPKYAQQILTIFRTFYNFCWTTKVWGGEETPAQRLGITNKVFDYKDIIYFR
jgi:transposase-like protein